MNERLSYEDKIAQLESELAKPVELKLEFHSDWNMHFPVEVKFGKSSKDGKVVLTNATLARIKKHAIEVAAKQQQRARSEIATLKTRAKAMKEILSKSGDMTFAEFASIYVKHVDGYEIVPGFELVAQHGLSSGRRYYYESDRLYRALEASRLADWDRGNEPRPGKDVKGALETKKLGELKPEDCFLRVVDTNGTQRRVPMDTTLHAWVRKVLAAAVTVGVLNDNPASLKVPKKVVKVQAQSAAAALRSDTKS